MASSKETMEQTVTKGLLVDFLPEGQQNIVSFAVYAVGGKLDIETIEDVSTELVNRINKYIKTSSSSSDSYVLLSPLLRMKQFTNSIRKSMKPFDCSKLDNYSSPSNDDDHTSPIDDINAFITWSSLLYGKQWTRTLLANFAGKEIELYDACRDSFSKFRRDKLFGHPEVSDGFEIKKILLDNLLLEIIAASELNIKIPEVVNIRLEWN